MTTGEYKRYKGLKKENLRDNMTNIELALNTLAEVATTEYSKQSNPKTMAESQRIAKEGGNVARAIPDKLAHLGLPFSKAYDSALQMYNAKHKK